MPPRTFDTWGSEGLPLWGGLWEVTVSCRTPLRALPQLRRLRPPALPLAPAYDGHAAMAGGGDRYCTYTELLAIARRFRQNPKRLMISWILRVYDQGGQALAALSSGSWPCSRLLACLRLQLPLQGPAG